MNTIIEGIMLVIILLALAIMYTIWLIRGEFNDG
jgi:hypothetical protein